MTVLPEELARSLVRRNRARQLQHAARAETLRGAIAAELGSASGVVRAWLIGSLAWGGFGELSDVDLVVEGASAQQAIYLGHELSRRFGVHVDVLRLEDMGADFRNRVVGEGIPIRGA